MHPGLFKKESSGYKRETAEKMLSLLLEMSGLCVKVCVWMSHLRLQHSVVLSMPSGYIYCDHRGVNRGKAYPPPPFKKGSEICCHVLFIISTIIPLPVS